MVIKKILFSAFQVSTFFVGAARGNAQLGARFVECDWPHSKSRRKFLIIGTLNVDEKKIRIKIGNELYPIRKSPQRQFFKDLDAGVPFGATQYFELVTSLYGDIDFDQWFGDKVRLWEEFIPETLDFTPVSVRTVRGLYIVEDGAHRLALSSLRGVERFDMGVSIWHFN